MALIADNPRDRAEQLALLTERLTALITQDTARILAREALLDGPEADEKARLANAYRLELARIKDDHTLLTGAPPHLLATLKTRTAELQAALERHELELAAVKLISEGLVQVMAEETVRQRGGGRGYGAGGDMEPVSGPCPTVLDRNA